MDFNSHFEDHFIDQNLSYESEISLMTKLQETRAALQESMSENDQLKELVKDIHSAISNEHSKLSNLLSEVPKPIFKNIAAPESPTSLTPNEEAGYSRYYSMFLGFSLRRMVEEYHAIRDKYESLQSTIEKSSANVEIVRTGAIKMPKLKSITVEHIVVKPEIVAPTANEEESDSEEEEAPPVPAPRVVSAIPDLVASKPTVVPVMIPNSKAVIGSVKSPVKKFERKK